MDRRRFLSRLTAASAAVGLEVGCGGRTGAVPGANDSAAAGAAHATRCAIYQVRGFTCITCAVGLEVMLRGVRGVTEASANYSESSVAVAFDEHLINEDAVKQFIGSCGFFAA